MYPIIGIISRKMASSSGKIIDVIYQDIMKSVIKSGGIPIGIPNDNIYPYLNICNGFILQGGDDIDENNLKIIKIIKEKNIPLLGICLGMQEMAYFENGIIYDIPNHKNNTLHEIVIDKSSLLYKILAKEKILVNSRHKSAVSETNLSVSAISSDNVIEAVEDKNHKFFLALQWHPENLYDIDTNARKIFDYFIEVCHN